MGVNSWKKVKKGGPAVYGPSKGSFARLVRPLGWVRFKVTDRVHGLGGAPYCPLVVNWWYASSSSVYVSTVVYISTLKADNGQFGQFLLKARLVFV